MKKVIFSALCLICVLCIMTGSVLGWFYAGSKVGEVKVTGNSPSSYFSSGDGSKATPYKISTPVHLYNLAWLQYIGYFYNTSNGLVQPYFELENNIDMSGYVLPPIGTSTYPFVGNFNGNSYTISNLTVCNSTESGGINNVPSAGFEGKYAQIIGFFGVVGDYSDALKNYKYDSSVVSVSNLYLNNITIKVQTTNALVGIVAGYVNGNVNNVGVLKSCIAVVGSSNKSINKISSFSKFSRSSLIGEWADGVSWTGMVSESDSTGGEGEGEGEGDVPNSGNEFGGSLDMYTLNRRLTYMFGASNAILTSVYGAYNFYDSNMNVLTPKFNAYLRTYLSSSYFYATKDKASSVSGTNKSTMFIYGGSYFPINADTKTMFETENTSSGQITYNGNTYQRYSTSYYSSHTSEAVLSTNTGYIVATTNKETVAATAVIGDLKQLENSVTFTSSGAISSLKLYGRNANGTYIIGEPKTDGDGNIIKNEYSNVTESVDNSYNIVDSTSSAISNYSTIKSQLVKSFSSVSGTLYYYGFRFEKAPNTTSYFTDATVSLNGNNYTGYELVQSAVNFHLKEDGIITAVVANILNDNNIYNTMFNIYEVNRNESDITKIDSVKQLTQASNGGISYDSSWYNNVQLNGYSAYFIQIPVKAGDYALGCEKGAYFLYLDIGASGSSETTPDTGDGDGEGDNNGETDMLIIKNVGFIDSIANISWENYKVVIIAINLTDLSEAAYIYYLRSSESSMLYYCDVDSLTIKAYVDDGVTAKSDGSAASGWTSGS